MGEPIPFNDLTLQHAPLRAALEAAIGRVLDDNAYIQGPHVQRFEEAFAERLGVAHCIGCSSGTAALVLALEAVGVRPGDDVITTAHTFFAGPEAILALGARPVFVDVDPRTATLDPAAVEAALTPRTRAILPVHIYGGVCDMDRLAAVAEAAGVPLVEDTAQAHLARWRDGAAGTLGAAGTFSFFPGKNLGALGDAGAVVTNDAALAERMRSMRDHGRLSKYEHGAIGFNHRMDGVQGAVLEVKLRHLDAWTEARREAAARYVEALAPRGIAVVETLPEAVHAYHLFVVRVPRRDAVQRVLQAAGIASGVHYPVPCHRQPALANMAQPSLPVTERLADEVLSLPLFPGITAAQQARVVDALSAAVDAVSAAPQADAVPG